nr:MAG TPA: hypothetical protein [Caudoviricetes sp.]
MFHLFTGNMELSQDFKRERRLISYWRMVILQFP